MRDRKRIVRVAGVLVIAGGIGHVMQYGDAIAARFAPEELVVAAAPMTQVAILSAPRQGDPNGLSFVPGAADLRPNAGAPLRLAQPEAVRVAALDTRTDAQPVPDRQADAACEARLSAETQPAALVRLTLNAPCHPQARVELRHELLEVIAFTDAAGKLEMVIPALAVTAEFTALLDGLPPVAAATEVQALTGYHRVAVTWAGAGSLELHAFENNAGYGTEGHVWYGAPKDPARADSGEGGFVLRLGHPDDPVPVMTDIYSIPADRAQSVRLTVESPVDRESCGLDLVGRAVQVRGGTAAAPVQIMLAMPPCDADGSYLVIDDIFPNQRIASR